MTQVTRANMLMWMSLISADRQCSGHSKACDQHLEAIPEFTWSIVAAGDLRDERNEKSVKKSGSPQGWEEGKNEGITFPRCRGISFFNKLYLAVYFWLMFNIINNM